MWVCVVLEPNASDAHHIYAVIVSLVDANEDHGSECSEPSASTLVEEVD